MRNKDSIERFFKERPDLFEGIDLRHAKIIIKTPWSILSQVVEGLKVVKVRMKYIGEFYPSLYKARYERALLIYRFKKNEVDHKVYFRRKAKYENFIKDYCKILNISYEEFISKEYRLFSRDN